MNSETEKPPFILLTFGEDDIFIPPSNVACFIKNKEEFDEFLAKHEQEHYKKNSPFVAKCTNSFMMM